MSPHVLDKGANLELASADGTAPAIIITVEVQALDGLGADASILLLGPDGRVRSNDDFIFYNQPQGADNAVRLLPQNRGTADTYRDSIQVELSSLPADVDRIVIGASIDEDTRGGLGAASAVTMLVQATDGDQDAIASFPISGLTCETALIFGEIYRKSGRWKIRAVGQGYADGLGAMVADFGVDVETRESAASEQPNSERGDPGAAPRAEAAEVPSPALPDDAEAPSRIDADGTPRVRIRKRRRSAPRMPSDWIQRHAPYVPAEEGTAGHRPARLFPTVGIKSSVDQEGRATSILLAMMEAVREFGRPIVAMMGGPRGRIDCFVETTFTLDGRDVRPDGLVRVTRGGQEWTALIEVKTGARSLELSQVEQYLQVAKARGFDAVVTISADLLPTPDSCVLAPNPRLTKTVALRHLAWEEIITEAALALHHTEVPDRTRSRLIREFIDFAVSPASGMVIFDDMGKHWVTARESVKDRTIGPRDTAAIETCGQFDRLIRHVALQLSALLGPRAVSTVPAEHRDAVSRVRQLVDSGKLFGSVRVPGAAAPIVIEADLRIERIACTTTLPAPRKARPMTDVKWLLRHLDAAEPRTRITAHHVGSRTEATAALLETARADPAVLVPPDGRGIREFSITQETRMGSKRAGSSGGFVTTITRSVNAFYAAVVQELRVPSEA